MTGSKKGLRKNVFEEKTPIFCTADVPFHLIGEHMKEHMRANNLRENPRRLLIGGTRARKIIIGTPLLEWYLKQGLHVARINQVIEFVPGPCFRNFVHEVSTARRLGD